MSNSSSLSSFDPFATHPFTSGQSQPPPHLHHPPPTRMPAPSPTAVPVQQQQQPQQPPSQPPSQPKPSSSSSTTTSQPQPIFTPWKQERSSTPELCDVLAKKKQSAWPAQPVFKSGSGR